MSVSGMATYGASHLPVIPHRKVLTVTLHHNDTRVTANGCDPRIVVTEEVVYVRFCCPIGDMRLSLIP